MTHQPHYNLPPFKRDFPFPPATDAGKWSSADGTLKQLAQSVKVDDEPFKDADEPVRAIPDPWAQPRTFGEALLDGSHSMHRTALAQWRGLLALFALQDMRSRDYGLAPHRVDLGDKHILDRVLKMLVPHVAMGGYMSLWETPWLIMMTRNGQADTPIAMTNPICLVSPGRRSLDTPMPGVQWSRNGFGDPLALPEPEALSITELVVLEKWLIRLRTALEVFADEVSGRIRELLYHYIHDCQRETGQSGLDAEVTDSIYHDLPELFRPLWIKAKLRPVANPAGMSQTRLRLRTGYTGDDHAALGEMKGVILVDPGLATLPGFSLRRTTVWGVRTLGEVLASDNIFEDVRNDAARAGYLLIKANDIFTDRCVRLANEPLIASHPASLQDTLLPLRPLTLLLEGAVKSKTRAQPAGSRVSVTYQVQLDNGGETGLAHDLTRHYTADAVPHKGLLVAEGAWSIYNASVWPNFTSPAWNSYLARFTYAIGRDDLVRPHQALSASHIAAELAECPDGAAAIARLMALNSGKRALEKDGRFLRSEKTSGSEFEEVQYSTLGFEALFYYDTAADRGDAMAGLVFLDLPEKHTSPRDVEVAVDFGTTNTVACFDDRLPITLESRLVQPVVFKDPDKTRNLNHAQRWNFSKFLPVEKRPTPTPTVALTRQIGMGSEGIWAFRNIIYFHSRQRHAVNGEASELNQFGRVAQDAKFNLKWSNEASHVEATRDFLAQFMTMIAVEAAARGHDPRHLLWRFSIPDSMSTTSQEKFKNNLDNIARTISTKIPADKSAVKPLYSEGLSAARFILQDAGFSPGSLNIVLDIGGGTTDVTIWKFRELVWKGSFQLAGQNFFTRAISQNPHILRPIGLDHWSALFAEERTDDNIASKDVPHLAELLFSGDNLQQALDTHWDSKLNLDVGKDLRITALVFVAGIAWYLGLVTRHLLTQGILSESDLVSPSFALCGRGAGLFKKMHGRRGTDEESDVTRALKVFGTAAGIAPAPSPQFFTTPDAKLEVVRGMISDNEHLIDASAKDGRRKAVDDCPAGLTIAFTTGELMTPDTLVSRDVFSSNVRDVDLSGLYTFLSELQASAHMRIDLLKDRPQGAHAQVITALRTYIDTAIKKGDPNHTFEPPFITALRAVVDELASPSEPRDMSRSRKHRLSMDFLS